MLSTEQFETSKEGYQDQVGIQVDTIVHTAGAVCIIRTDNMVVMVDRVGCIL
jgi:hypothetical protein